MTTAFKIWITAQALAFIGFAFQFQEAALLASPFTIVGGLPSIIFFGLWFRALQKVQLSRSIGIVLTLIIIPAITWFNAFVFERTLDRTSSELTEFMLAPIIASFIAAAIFTPGFMQIQHRYYRERQTLIDQIAE